MKRVKQSIFIVFSGLFLLTLSGCAPEVGSDKWCDNMKEQPKSEWTAGDAGDFAKHCILK